MENNNSTLSTNEKSIIFTVSFRLSKENFIRILAHRFERQGVKLNEDEWTSDIEEAEKFAIKDLHLAHIIREELIDYGMNAAYSDPSDRVLKWAEKQVENTIFTPDVIQWHQKF